MALARGDIHVPGARPPCRADVGARRRARAARPPPPPRGAPVSRRRGRGGVRASRCTAPTCRHVPAAGPAVLGARRRSRLRRSSQCRWRWPAGRGPWRGCRADPATMLLAASSLMAPPGSAPPPRWGLSWVALCALACLPPGSVPLAGGAAPAVPVASAQFVDAGALAGVRRGGGRGVVRRRRSSRSRATGAVGRRLFGVGRGGTGAPTTRRRTTRSARRPRRRGRRARGRRPRRGRRRGDRGPR